MTGDILEDTYCLYCQSEFTSPSGLQRHVLSKHPDTYAFHAIQRRRAEVTSSSYGQDDG